MKNMMTLSLALAATLAATACSSDSSTEDDLTASADAGTPIDDPEPDAGMGPAEQWSLQFGGDDKSQTVAELATDTAGNLLVTGEYEGDIEFGGEVLSSRGGNDIFVAKLDPQGGHVWSQSFGDDARYQYPYGLAAGPDDEVLVAGKFEGSLTFGTEELESEGGADIFVAKLNADGTAAWGRRFGDQANYQQAQDVAVDADGNVIIVGDYQGSVTFGDDTYTTLGSSDIFIAKLSPEGTPLWSKSFGSANKDLANAVSIGPDNSIVVAGNYTGALDFGAGLLPHGGGSDVFLAKFAADGTPAWSHGFGDDGTRQIGAAVATDSQGNIILAANFEGGLDFGGGFLESEGAKDVGLALFSPDGVHQWSNRFGDGLPDTAASIAFDAEDRLFVTGQFRGNINFGGATLESETHATYLAKFSTTGEHLQTRHFAGEGDFKSRAICIDQWGQGVVGGRFWGDTQIDGVMLSSERGDYDAFVTVIPEPSADSL